MGCDDAASAVAGTTSEAVSADESTIGGATFSVGSDCAATCWISGEPWEFEVVAVELATPGGEAVSDFSSGI
jgi:hypothetical protein